MKCSPFSKRFMMRKRGGHFLKRHLMGDHHSSMSHGMGHDHHQRRRMSHGDFGHHHRRNHGHGKHFKMGHHHMHHPRERQHEMHPKMHHFKRRQLEFTREESDDPNALHEINMDGSPSYAPKSKSQVTKENNKFKICLDTSHYQPVEVFVKIVGNKIEVSAVHESIGGDWFEFHEMQRSFDIPDDVNLNTITSHLDSSGKLTIEATINTEEDDTAKVREIPVIQVNE